MLEVQKENIRYLRGEGLGYGAIAARLGISENTVKSFCRRNGLSGIACRDMPPMRGAFGWGSKTEWEKILLGGLPPRVVERPPEAG